MSEEPLVFGDLKKAAEVVLCAKCGSTRHLSWCGVILCDGCGLVDNKCDCKEQEEEPGDEYDWQD